MPDLGRPVSVSLLVGTAGGTLEPRAREGAITALVSLRPSLPACSAAFLSPDSYKLVVPSLGRRWGVDEKEISLATTSHGGWRLASPQTPVPWS